MKKTTYTYEEAVEMMNRRNEEIGRRADKKATKQAPKKSAMDWCYENEGAVTSLGAIILAAVWLVAIIF